MISDDVSHDTKDVHGRREIESDLRLDGRARATTFNGNKTSVGRGTAFGCTTHCHHHPLPSKPRLRALFQGNQALDMASDRALCACLRCGIRVGATLSLLTTVTDCAVASQQEAVTDLVMDSVDFCP